jgi:hypothetical protein
MNSTQEPMVPVLEDLDPTAQLQKAERENRNLRAHNVELKTAAQTDLEELEREVSQMRRTNRDLKTEARQ